MHVSSYAPVGGDSSRASRLGHTSCPGIWHLVQARDGLLARFRLFGGRLTGETSSSPIITLAQLAQQFGDGFLYLTSRSGVQIRGITQPEKWREYITTLAKSQPALVSCSEIDRSRNVLFNAVYASVEEERLARKILSYLAEHADILAPRFSVVLDSSPVNLAGLPHDIAFHGSAPAVTRGAVDDIAAAPLPLDSAKIAYQLSLRNRQSGLWFRLEQIFEVVSRLICTESRVLNLQQGRVLRSWVEDSQFLSEAVADDPLAAVRDLSISFGSGIAVPSPLVPDSESEQGSVNPFFGKQTTENGYELLVLTPKRSRLDQAQCSALERWHQLGCNAYALPWHSIAIAAASCNRETLSDVEAEADQYGFSLDAGVSRPHFIACPGERGCVRGNFDTHAVVDTLRRRTGERGAGVYHVSGCLRGCAWGAAADKVIVSASTSTDTNIIAKEQIARKATKSGSQAYTKASGEKLPPSLISVSACHPRDLSESAGRG